MQFAVLGPLLVHDGETQVGIPKGRLRVLLAALLLHAGQPVAVGTLAEFLWDGAPPPGAAVTLRSHVQRLRHVLGPRAGARLVTRHPGYLLQAGDDEIDVLRFRGLCRDGHTALRQGTWARADELLGEALALWRGPALTDVRSDLLLREEAPGLEELRLQAEEWRADAALHLGRHDELIAGLQSLTARHPLRERFHAQLMLTLYRCGRQAEALTAYQHARHLLVAELGTEPGPELRQLHQQVLSDDPALATPEPASPAEGSSGPSVIPRELPPAVPHFTGRTQELAALTRLLDRPGQDAPGTVVISAIGGTAGVGKTALAMQFAHQIAERFPDGQLYANLRGYDPDQPIPTAEALGGFLRALGTGARDIPGSADERAARYRSLTAGKRILVVLDNVRSVEQARPLLPASSGCAVLVTSRDMLSGLVARDGASRLDLDMLPLADAVELLRALIGKRAKIDPDATARLADLCCRLPLALRVAAELASARASTPLGELAGELADLHQRLDLLDADGDRRTDVRSVLSWSYRHLDNDAAHAFRLLGSHFGSDFDSYTTAALTGTNVDHSRRTLGKLARAHLVQPAGPDRYGMHDLLRAYARQLASDLDDTGSALTRLSDHYVQTAMTAVDTLFPAEPHPRPETLTPIPPLIDLAAARSWLEASRASLMEVAGHSPGHAAGLATILSRYLDTYGHHHDTITIGAQALTGARRAGDRAAEASALLLLGTASWRLSHYDDAERQFGQALTLFRELGDLPGQLRALSGLGSIDSAHGRHELAADCHRQALAVYRELGDRLRQADALHRLGGVLCQQGFPQRACEPLREALQMYRELGERHGEGGALSGLGITEWWQGRYERAAGYFRRALAIYGEIGDRPGQAHALGNLGVMDWWQGRFQQSAHFHDQAVAIYRELGDQAGEAGALNARGEALCAVGSPDQAAIAHRDALAVAGQAGDLHQQARAHEGLGYSCQASHDLDRTRHHWEQATAIYTRLGASDASDVRARLDELDKEPAGDGEGLTVDGGDDVAGVGPVGDGDGTGDDQTGTGVRTGFTGGEPVGFGMRGPLGDGTDPAADTPVEGMR